VTWDQFLSELGERLLDPKGLLAAGIMGAVVAGADVRLGGVRGVEIVDKKGSPLGDFDGIRAGVIIENKSGLGIGRIDPRTGQSYPGTSPQDFAQKQIYGKTKVRIDNLRQAIQTRPQAKITEDPAQAAGSSVFPSLKDVLTLRKIKFHIDAGSPAHRTAVEAQINRLRTENPDWTFTARYGQ
jgi:hypothetical protein